jgi:hypothetical protein
MCSRDDFDLTVRIGFDVRLTVIIRGQSGQVVQRFSFRPRLAVGVCPFELRIEERGRSRLIISCRGANERTIRLKHSLLVDSGRERKTAEQRGDENAQ